MSYKKDFGLVIVGAILFIASFLWIKFISEVENFYCPKTNGLMGRFIYTLIVTLFLVAIAVGLRYYFGINGNKTVEISGEPHVEEQAAHENLNENGENMHELGLKIFGTN